MPTPFELLQRYFEEDFAANATILPPIPGGKDP